MLSRWRDPAAPHSTTPELDRAIDLAARDVSFLLDHNLLSLSGDPARRVPQSHEDAEELAAQLRRDLGLDDRPLNDLAEVTERVGVVSCSPSVT